MRSLVRMNLETGINKAYVAPEELLDKDNEGIQLFNEGAAIEAAHNNLTNVIETAANLEDAGVSPECVQSTLGVVAVDTLFSIDGTMAEEATVALEDDSPSGFWNNMKKKALEIWEAIKKHVSKFWKWLKSFFSTSYVDHEVVAKEIVKEMNAMKAAAAETKDKAKETASGGKESSKTDDKASGSSYEVNHNGPNSQITIAADIRSAMLEKGWRASEVITRIMHYSKEIVPHAKAVAKQIDEITNLSKYNLKQIKIKAADKTAEQIIITWQEAAEEAKGNYIGESKFVNSTPILIGFNRTSGGYAPNQEAEGDIVFKNANEVAELGKALKAYGDASMEAIKILQGIDRKVDELMKEAETFMNGLDKMNNQIDEGLVKRLMPLMRSVMFRQIDMMKEYAQTHGLKAQWNGLQLMRKVRKAF